MQDAARDEYAHALCTLGEIVPSGTVEGYAPGFACGIGTLRVMWLETNTKSAPNWNAKLEG
jgi:hypothetical protein